MPVTLAIQNRVVVVEGDGIRHTVPLDAARIDHTSCPGASIVRFPDGAACEVPDTPGLVQLVERAQRSQWDDRSPRALWVMLAAVVLVAVGAYVYGIPFLARLVADAVPAAVTTPISESVLASLDAGPFTPTKLPPARQGELRAGFARLIRGADGGQAYRLEFRGGGDIGPNALALPSGIIVVTDELVQLARDDREILGVLAHEAGHVAERHGVRLVFQESAVGMLLAWVVGDFSTLAAVAPATLMQAKYSRDLERDADRHAAELLQRRGIPPSLLADLLARMDAAGRQRQSPAGSVPLLDYVSSHPATHERLAYLRSL